MRGPSYPKQPFLGGGLKHFLFSPRNLGKISHLSTHYGSIFLMRMRFLFPLGHGLESKNATVLSIQWETRISRIVQLKCDESTTKWAIPEKVEGFPINLVHLFSGAYGGWERASFWLHHKRFFHLQQTIAIDNDEEVMKVWQLRNDANVYLPPFSNGDFHAKNIGIYSGIENDEWLNVCQSQSNSILTMSPPCQPWSMGGKGQGFESNNGLAFAHAIRKVKLLRPPFVCAECADQITKHSHFRIIKAAFAIIGYKLQWMNVIPKWMVYNGKNLGLSPSQ